MTKEDLVREALASTPPTTVSALTLVGVSLQDWVLIMTLIWLMIQIGYFTYKRIKGVKDDGSD